jgi:hypothetical protein
MNPCTRGKAYRDVVGGEPCPNEATRYFRLGDTRLCYAACPDHSRDTQQHYHEIDKSEYEDIQESVRVQPISR